MVDVSWLPTLGDAEHRRRERVRATGACGHPRPPLVGVDALPYPPVATAEWGGGAQITYRCSVNDGVNSAPTDNGGCHPEVSQDRQALRDRRFDPERAWVVL